MIFFFILITCLLDIVLILWGEILSWSVMGVKGLRWESRKHFVVVTEEGNIYLFIRLYQRTLKRKHLTQHGKLFVNIFSYALQYIWRTINTIASILCKNILVYLSLDIICTSKLTVFLEPLEELFTMRNRSCLWTNIHAYFGTEKRLFFIYCNQSFK